MLLINYEYPPLGGGAANATLFIARALASLGHRAIVLTSGFADLPHREDHEGVVVHRVQTMRKALDRSNQREMASFMMVAAREIHGIASAAAVDAVIAFFTIPSGPIAWWYWRKTRVPYVISLRGGDVPGFVPKLAVVHAVLTPLRRAILRNAKAVVANSASLARLSTRTDPIPVHVIPNGVDANVFRPVAVQGAESRFCILFVGRVHTQKNIDVLLRACARLRDLPLQLHVVGDGPELPRLRALAGTLGIAQRVSWHGWGTKEQVAAAYRDADCFVNPSKYEGMPNTVLEAMASGLPVIASDVGGNNEVVRDGDTGLLFAAGSVDGLERALTRLATDADLRRHLGERSRTVVLAEHSWDVVARAYSALLAGPPGECGAQETLPVLRPSAPTQADVMDSVMP